jgi:hypothetical protein
MYNNLPYTTPPSAADQAYNNQFNIPFGLDSNVFALMKGFFESRSFDSVAAEVLAVTFMQQAAADNYNPMEVLTQLKGVDSVKLNAIAIELINYNRYKTSYLGTNRGLNTFQPVSRNVLP